MKCTPKTLLLVVAVCLLAAVQTNCKRGGGSRRGGMGRGTSVWGRSKSGTSGYDSYNNRRKNQNQQDPVPPAQPKPPDVPKVAAPPAKTAPEVPPQFKASAPPASNSASKASGALIANERGGAAAPPNTQQRPIGWNVPGAANKPPEGTAGKNVGWNVGSSAPGQRPPGYNNNQGQQPPSYNQAVNSPNLHGAPPPAYGTNPHGQYPAHYPPSYNQAVGGHYAGPPPAYGGYNNMGGYGGGYHQQGYGGGGGFLGGGGFGGGGFGGGYGMGYKRSGFGSGFGQHAVRNVLAGMLIWHLVSGFTRRPYTVHNYYNNPESVPQNVELPANLIVVCPENVTALCAPNTVALCTSTETIMCATSAQQTVPCADNATSACVSSTVDCKEEPDACADGKAAPPIGLPCITNATISGKLSDGSPVSGTGTAALVNPDGSSSVLCVTTYATPQPENEADPGAEVPLDAAAVAPEAGIRVSVCNGTEADDGNSTDCIELGEGSTKGPIYKATIIRNAPVNATA